MTHLEVELFTVLDTEGETFEFYTNASKESVIICVKEILKIPELTLCAKTVVGVIREVARLNNSTNLFAFTIEEFNALSNAKIIKEIDPTLN